MTADGFSAVKERTLNGLPATNNANSTHAVDGVHNINGVNGVKGINGHSTNGLDNHHAHDPAMPSDVPGQVPIAVIGLSCRLPGNNNSPESLWKFLAAGGIADPTPPSHRYNFATHFDGSGRPGTMPSPGGMLLKDVDITAFDASFFKIAHGEAAVMDPQQRQLLEVVYECLENSGVPLSKLAGTLTGCIAANNALEYETFCTWDREDRLSTSSTGLSRSILANRVSHFFDIRGPSIAIDTACSGTLVGIDMACRYLQTRQADGMLVGGSMLYLDPSALWDTGAMRGAFSPTGYCKPFDASADGYIRSEAVSCVYLKRLDDALRDADPIRAVIRGSATTCDGNTPSLTQPSSEAQARAIRIAYRNAGISNYAETGYLECHGTGTPTGDPIEVRGLASVFAASRPADQPLIIGSIKANVGHSESAAGLSGLIKAVLTVESGVIPGTPCFINPTPHIDFAASRVRPSRRTIRWPKHASPSGLRRASVNSFGFGGSNAHVVLESYDSMVDVAKHPKTFVFSSHGSAMFGSKSAPKTDEGSRSPRSRLLVFSANDQEALSRNVQTLAHHLSDPAVEANIADVAYTLSHRRTHHFHRGFIILNSTEIDPELIVTGKEKAQPPRVAFVFTGQGAQWSQMGRNLIATFPAAKAVVESLDLALQTLGVHAPRWSLMEELTQKRDAEALKQPEFSQPLVTALQLAQLAVLDQWGVSAARVIGHSSGEIAAAAAAGRLTPDEAIKVAYFRGLAAKRHEPSEPLGMLAVGVSDETIKPYLNREPTVQIACYNSPTSLTLSGTQAALARLHATLEADSIFARMLQVNIAYHSEHVSAIAEDYHALMCEAGLSQPDVRQGNKAKKVTLFSSVTSNPIEGEHLGPDYWRLNMIFPVRFAQAANSLLSGKDSSEFLVELGPAGVLAGPISQIISGMSSASARSTQYTSAAKRGAETLQALYQAAGKLWACGGSVDLAQVNGYDDSTSLVVDLPNYQWNHGRRYWKDTVSGQEFLQRPFVSHDLLGSKILSVPWDNPTFYRVLDVNEVPWLRDHQIGGQIIFPGAAYVALAVEAIRQQTIMTRWRKPNGETEIPDSFAYRLKNVEFMHSLALEENTPAKITLSLTPVHGSPRAWFEFRIRSLVESSKTWISHCTGLVLIDEKVSKEEITAPRRALEPLSHPHYGAEGYKNANAGEFSFGPAFQRIERFDWVWGSTECRAEVNVADPPAHYAKQSEYPVHPAAIDGLSQVTGYAIAQMQMKALDDVDCMPKGIRNILIPHRKTPAAAFLPALGEAYPLASSGSRTHGSRYASADMFDPNDKTLVMRIDRIRFVPIAARADGGEYKHVYMHMGWSADLAMTGVEGLGRYLQVESKEHRVQKMLDAFAYQKPGLAVAEINLDDNDESCLWLHDLAKLPSSSPRRGWSRFHCITNNVQALFGLQEAHAEAPRSTFELLDVSQSTGIIAAPEKFDLIIVKTAGDLAWATTALGNARAALSENGSLVVLHPREDQDMSSETQQVLGDLGLSRVLDLSSAVGGLALLASGSSETVKDGNKVTCIRFTNDEEQANGLLASLRDQGWEVECTTSLDNVARNSDLLVVSELWESVATGFTSEQWDKLQAIIAKECNLLWVTQGGQLSVTHPERAAVPGFLRTVRQEEPLLRIITLDVENATGSATAGAVDRCLSLLKQPVSHNDTKDSEFVERDGIMYVPRVLADAALNEAKHEPADGRKPQTEDLDKKTPICLGVERTGTLDSLQYSERASAPVPIQDGHIEIEVHAAGINFKDIAIALGIVDTNDPFSLGGEAAGIVTRAGQGVDPSLFAPGCRVVAMFPGSFANRIQAPVQVAHRIPDSLTFSEAATLPVAFLTAIHGLLELGNLARGQRVLIHSATGGTGSAAVQVAKHIGAEIFATAGSPEKRLFLQTAHGISADHIFDSRTAEFEREIMRLTRGQGVDVVLNSLTGDLLEASWNTVGHNGVMVEIGKKDIAERGRLSMEPFSRGASYRALDLTLDTAERHGKGPELGETLKRLFGKLFALIEAGHVRPIFPLQTFAFDQVVEALRLMRSTKHMGKLVLARNPNGPNLVQVRPAPRLIQFRPDATILLVGGVKGICGSLAVDFAKKGAKHLAIVSRSGYADPQSQYVVRQLRDLGCQVDLLKGDISSLDDVNRIFKETSVPIAGIIQGAMVLEDRPATSMTLQEYHTALAPKIQGTWNLHHAAQANSSTLDFFTTLSSISSVLGTAAQANYSAGCSFQDAFARYRQQLDLPAGSINLGIVEQVGYMARHEELIQKNVGEGDVAHGINEQLLCRIVGYSILQQSQDPISRGPEAASARAQMITGLVMPQAAESPLRLDARFGPLFVRADDRAGDQNQDGSTAAAKDDASQRIKEINAMLKSKTARAAANLPQLVDATVAVLSAYLTRAMRLSEPIEPERPVAAYGIDSLAAVEFRNWLRLELGAALSVIDITTAPSLNALAERVISKVEVA